MTKLRTPGTIEDALDCVFGKIGRKQAAHILDKSESMMGRWADPDDDSRLIPAAHMVTLDQYLVSQGHDPVFAPFLARCVADIERPHVVGCPVSRLGAMSKEFGEAAQAYADAVQADYDMQSAQDAAREIAEVIAELHQARNDILSRVRANQLHIVMPGRAAE